MTGTGSNFPLTQVITVMCPNLTCRAILRVPPTTRGKKVRCSQCGTSLIIPAVPPAPQTESPGSALTSMGKPPKDA